MLFFQPKNLDPDSDLTKSLDLDPECYEYGSATQLKYCGFGPDAMHEVFLFITGTYWYRHV
jgi:hypothetical protein